MNNMDQMLNIANVSYDIETYLIKRNENVDLESRNYNMNSSDWDKMNQWFVKTKVEKLNYHQILSLLEVNMTLILEQQ